MALTLQNKWAVATVSLGKHASHTLERKVKAAAENGFAGIELVHADLIHHAKQNNITPLESAGRIKKLCAQWNIEILSLNPFKNFEGHPTLPLEERLDTAKQWLELAAAVGAKHLQVPSQFLKGSTSDYSVIIPELQALADLAAEHDIKVAYEAVAFAASNMLWQDSLDIVNAVNKPNFGLCLDSFHIQSYLWGDPYTVDGKLPNADQAIKQSMAEFLKTCPMYRIFYVQLSDASKFDPPFTDDSPLCDGLEVKDARLAWSRSLRPFPLEAPGYFPVADIAKTWLVDYQWKGWVSLEGFLAETSQEQNGPEEMARRGKESIEKLCSSLGVSRDQG